MKEGKVMQTQAYEGYFENGLFYAAGQVIHLPERQKIYIKVLGELLDCDLDYEDDDDYDYSVYFTEEELLELKAHHAQKGEVLVFGKGH